MGINKNEDNNVSCCERTTDREDKLKLQLIKRLNRIEGQIRGIRGMIEKDVYCDDILNQVAAASSALNSVSKLILEDHVRGCLVRKIKNGEDGVIDELIKTIDKLL